MSCVQSNKLSHSVVEQHLLASLMRTFGNMNGFVNAVSLATDTAADCDVMEMMQ